MKDRRWDIDERGQGVSNAGALAPGVHELVEALTIEDWVAEEPDAHLLPHIRRACAEAGLELLGHELDGAVFVVRIGWVGQPRPDEAREAVYRVIGAFAESATSVRERKLSFEIVTGMLDQDTPFKSHGHMVRIDLVPHE
jgi:hypothetical protein